MWLRDGVGSGSGCVVERWCKVRQCSVWLSGGVGSGSVVCG